MLTTCTFLLQDTPPSTLLREDLPLPPPPPEITSISECINFDTLPPPPPEAFRNRTLTLETFPPPPNLPEDGQDSSWLTEPGITALPPPASLMQTTDLSPEKISKVRVNPAVPPKPRKGVRRRQSESDARATPPRLTEHHNRLIVVKPKPSKPSMDLELNYATPCDMQEAVQTPASPPTRRCHRNSSHVSESKPHRSRRTSAPCVPNGQLQVHDTTSPTEPSSKASDRKSRSQFKPSPPKRSENTKLSSAFTAPQRRSASASASPYDQEETPPESFLLNLQKVMVKKWKVAQQLTNDNSSSHQILGFRDPNCLPAAAEGTSPLRRSPSSPPPLPTHVDKKHHRSSSQSGAPKSKKHPPPPPPKKPDSSKVSMW